MYYLHQGFAVNMKTVRVPVALHQLWLLFYIEKGNPWGHQVHIVLYLDFQGLHMVYHEIHNGLKLFFQISEAQKSNRQYLFFD